MNQDYSKESGQVEFEKSEEEPTQLLEKFEKDLIGSITRSVEIADSLSWESTSDQVRDLTVSTDFEKRRWEFLNPIVLYKNNWMGARTEGIRLEKGTYKVKYRVTSIASKGTGLALFNKDTKKVENLLYWQIGAGNSESIINESGTQYLAIRSPSIINITDIQGNFNPGGIESIYIVTVFRRKTLPD